MNNLQDQLTVFGYSLIFWITLFYVVNNTVEIKGVSKKNMNDIKNRLVAIAHGLTMCFLTGYHIIVDRPLLDVVNTNF